MFYRVSRAPFETAVKFRPFQPFQPFRPFRPSQSQCRQPYHTTPFRSINPLAAIGVRIAARFLGRQAKVKWNKLPKEERKRLKQKLKGRDGFSNIHAASVLCGVGGLGWYFTHLEQSPITGRFRYLSISREEMAKIGTAQSNEMKSALKASNLLYDPTGPTYKQVHKIVQNLIEGLAYVPDLKSIVDDHGENIDWQLYVVSSYSEENKNGITNAFVLPSGKIFVYDGILAMCKDDAALAAVLAHEMSHAILEHSREQHSSANGPTLLLRVLLTAGVWFLGMDWWASFAVEGINDYIISIVSELP